MPHSDVTSAEALGTALAARGGPVAIVFADGRAQLADTLDHLAASGFAALGVVDATGLAGTIAAAAGAVRLPLAFRGPADRAAILNAAMAPLAGRWVHPCRNGEYLFHPFLESRSIGEVTQFMEDERRTSVFGCTVDLYAPSGAGDPRAEAHFDTTGYFARDRHDGAAALDRQIDVQGGLRWRFEDHIPWEERHLDRVGLFQARAGLEFDAGLRLNDPEMNTIACPWHNSLTVAVASFRAAMALRHNPGSTAAARDLMAPQSRHFDWTSRQLLEMGLLEPGQWF
jgi:hypothetical protein